MRLGGLARYVAEIDNESDLVEAYHFARENNLPTYILGGGSNVIGRDEGFAGVILLNRMKGISVFESDAEKVRITAQSGTRFGDLVEFSTKLWNGDSFGYSGIEALAEIPGSVGAAPVQNIGAYGQEIGDSLYRVGVYDTREQRFRQLTKAQLGLGYRRSIFNHGAEIGRYFITNVTVELSKKWMEPPFYNSLQAYFNEHNIADLTPAIIRKAVSDIRSRKLPDPRWVASSGSFFKNIYLDPEAAEAARERGIPVFDNGKVAAGWLIENAGLKGCDFYGMRVSEDAALVLINERAKSYADLARARAAIVAQVYDKFGLTLEQEPVEIGG